MSRASYIVGPGGEPFGEIDWDTNTEAEQEVRRGLLRLAAQGVGTVPEAEAFRVFSTRQGWTRLTGLQLIATVLAAAADRIEETR